MKNTFYLFLALLLAVACQQKEAFLEKGSINNAEELFAAELAFNGIPTEVDYKTSVLTYLNNMGMTPLAVNNQKAGLGRVLFYDKNLSKNNQISCGSCHKPEYAFSDNVAKSVGISGNLTSRNSQPLANVASFSAHYAGKSSNSPLLLWDGRAADVRTQSRMAFNNPIEMDMQMSEVVERIRAEDYYPYLWRRAFGHFEPTEAEILEAIEAFVGTIGSANSPLDRAINQAMGVIDIPNGGGIEVRIIRDTIVRMIYYSTTPIDTTITIDTIKIETFFPGMPSLSDAANKGRAIFIANCTKCHSPIRSFQEVFEACNGLDMVYEDKGLGGITHNSADDGVFKSPSLRNIALTAPYMHDGRFKTLREVVNFYSDGVLPHPNLHPLIRRGGDPRLHLTDHEKQNLIAFLHTMTDHNFTAGNIHSNPFK